VREKEAPTMAYSVSSDGYVNSMANTAMYLSIFEEFIFSWSATKCTD